MFTNSNIFFRWNDRRGLFTPVVRLLLTIQARVLTFNNQCGALTTSDTQGSQTIARLAAAHFV